MPGGSVSHSMHQLHCAINRAKLGSPLPLICMPRGDCSFRVVVQFRYGGMLGRTDRLPSGEGQAAGSSPPSRRARSLPSSRRQTADWRDGLVWLAARVAPAADACDGPLETLAPGAPCGRLHPCPKSPNQNLAGALMATQTLSLAQQLTMFSSMAWRLGPFLRDRLTPERAVEMSRRGLATREESFLQNKDRAMISEDQ
jgi:hypothetical protein